jgi:hypothetical protein
MTEEERQRIKYFIVRAEKRFKESKSKSYILAELMGSLCGLAGLYDEIYFMGKMKEKYYE